MISFPPVFPFGTPQPSDSLSALPGASFSSIVGGVDHGVHSSGVGVFPATKRVDVVVPPNVRLSIGDAVFVTRGRDSTGDSLPFAFDIAGLNRQLAQHRHRYTTPAQVAREFRLIGVVQAVAEPVRRRTHPVGTVGLTIVHTGFVKPHSIWGGQAGLPAACHVGFVAVTRRPGAEELARIDRAPGTGADLFGGWSGGALTQIARKRRRDEDGNELPPPDRRPATMVRVEAIDWVGAWCDENLWQLRPELTPEEVEEPGGAVVWHLATTQQLQAPTDARLVRGGQPIASLLTADTAAEADAAKACRPLVEMHVFTRLPQQVRKVARDPARDDQAFSVYGASR